MIRILHCADLHLINTPAEDRNYSLAVLDEIIGLARAHGADYLVFAGDTFNSYADAEALRGEFRSRVAPLDGCEVILLAGNHEDLGRNKRSLASFDFGIAGENIIESGGSPFRLLRRDGIEFLAVPHRGDYGGYTEWAVPEKVSPVRLALAHGIVAGMAYTGEDEESDSRAAVMDADLFNRFSVDYAAMGHIHGGRRERMGAVEISYPGSARVWRKNEIGPRHADLLEVGAAVKATPLVLSSAGEYRSVELFVNFEGDIDALPHESEGWGAADYIRCGFFGVVENEGAARGNIKRMLDELASRVRRVEHDINLAVLEGISTQPLARKFLELWAAREPASADPGEVRAWRKARELGLRKIKEVMEARSC